VTSDSEEVLPFFHLQKMSGILIPLILGNILLTLGEAIVSNVYSSFLYWEEAPLEDDIAFYGQLYFIALTGTGIAFWGVFYYWYYEAYKNLKVLSKEKLKTSSIMAIVYFFIPIINLWRPYFTTKEIWKFSDPNISATGETLKYKHEKINIVRFWWVTLILGLVFMFLANNEILVLDTISDVFFILSQVSVFFIIKEITFRQESKYRLLYHQSN